LLPGEGIVQGLEEVGQPNGRGLLILAQMSSKGSLAHGAYTDECVRVAKRHPGFVIGFIAQERLVEDHSDLVTMTPGVGLAAAGDSLGQQYRTPEQVLVKDRSDIIIVGRGIYTDRAQVAENARRYRDAGWSAYLLRRAPRS
jgi:orotidine-5'-phosphate decarboxylase